jgi:hypothetical protein
VVRIARDVKVDSAAPLNGHIQTYVQQGLAIAAE